MTVAILVVPLALAQFGDPATGEGGPGWYEPVYVGTDVTFGPSEGSLPAGWRSFNWTYLGSSAAEGGCTMFGDPQCMAFHEDGYWYAGSTSFWGEPAGVRDARAGVGMGYELRQRCDGQDTDARPMWVNMTYALEEAYAQTAGTGTTRASVELWANPAEGRGGLLGESRDPVTGEDTPGYNVLLGEAHAGPGAGSDFIGDDPGFAALRVDTPQMGQRAALLYGHARTEKAPAGPLAYAEISASVHGIAMDFHDDLPPVAWINVTNAANATMAPASSGGGYQWFRQPLRAVFDAEDDYSCPRSVQVDDLDSSSDVVLDHAFGQHKDALVLDHGVDGKWAYSAGFVDWAGNEVNLLKRIGLDRVAPVVTATPDPAEPDGANGWYRSPAGVRFALACHDATSGCVGGSYRFGAGAWVPVSSFPANTTTAPEGVNALSCQATDVSGLAGTSCGNVVKYDKTAPSPSVQCGAAKAAAYVACSTSPWIRQPATVRVTCQDAGGSDAANGNRCWHLNYTLDNGGEVYLSEVTGATVNVSGDGNHTFALTTTDHAGNTASGVYTFAVDSTTPTKPSVTQLNGGGTIRVHPSWSWDATDTGSGIAEYRVYINGVLRRTTSATSATVSNGPEGQNCATVIAVDQAGNQGPESDPSCVFVDRQVPWVEILEPDVGGWVYRDGMKWVQHAPGLPIMLGNATFSTEAYDPGGNASSGLVLHESLLNGAAWTPLEGSNVCAPPGPVCDHTYVHTWGHGWKNLTGHVKDGAGNQLNSTRRMAITDLVGWANSEAAHIVAVHYAQITWIQPTDLTRIEVHRAGARHFTPSLTTLQASLPGSATEHRDNAVTPSANYWYKSVGYAMVGGVETPVWTSVEYPVRIGSPITPPGVVTMLNPPDDFS